MARKYRSRRDKLNWYRIDLHLHTPASNDYLEPKATYLDILRKAEMSGLDIIAFTDHNTVSGIATLRREIEELYMLEQLKRIRQDEQQRLNEYRRLSEKILLLPGFELTATFGFHIIGIFPPQTSVRELEHILLNLRVPSNLLDVGSTQVGATVDVLTAYRIINEAGGLVVAAHANSTHGVAMQGFNFGGQTKIAYTQDPNLHVLEVTDLESRRRNRTANFYNGSKPEYPRRMHCIQGSDAHRVNQDPHEKNRLGVGGRITEVGLKERSFEALKALFMKNDFSKTRPFRATQAPFDHVLTARQQGTNIVQGFYESVNRRGGHLHAILCDICAFANTNGGALYVGVSNNPHKPAVGITKPTEAMDLIRSEVEKRITPPLEIQIERQETQGKKILQISIPLGVDPPYAIDENKIYVRDETETNLAVRDEIVALVKRNIKTEAVAPTSKEIQSSGKATPPPEESTTNVETSSSGAPKTGVEIVIREERKGKIFYSLRDLRNGNIVHNVTKKSARKLWQYAIKEYETNTVDEKKVTWQGEIGLWKKQQRGEQVRFDLVQRGPNDRLHVYYGVTYDGIDGMWQTLMDSAENDSNG
ncbi:putative DNA binding domain-containing protein [Anaerolineales bacterium HSG6]|nr:putative DNA binding domain-containing protein [Anaerolineales bacterium HSG6]MDM8531577.1 putative DNA binding domain-containing protein [Anaerolineales bacterium HSG25]